LLPFLKLYFSGDDYTPAMVLPFQGLYSVYCFLPQLQLHIKAH